MLSSFFYFLFVFVVVLFVFIVVFCFLVVECTRLYNVKTAEINWVNDGRDEKLVTQWAVEAEHDPERDHRSLPHNRLR